MFEVALCRIIDNVFQGDRYRLAAELDLEGLVWLISQAVEKQRVYGSGLFSYQTRQCGTFCPMTLTGRAKAAEEVNFQSCCLGQLIRRQLGCSLIKIVGDAHRANRVRA